MYDSIIIGAGPAGMTAGIYLARSKKKVLILDKGIPGGQMILTHEIANYPGYESISGYGLSMNMMNQAKKFGVEFITNQEIKTLNLAEKLKKVILKNGAEFTGKSILIASGGRSRRLGVKGEDEFTGRGISFCATCDGDFFTDKEIIVVGGGNSALEEAVSLTKFASKVTIVHQFDHFQAFDIAIEEAKINDKIHFIMDSRIIEFKGQEKLESVCIENIKSGEKSETKIDGTFIFIGYMPNSEMFKEKVNTNKFGEIEVDGNLKTSLEGIFAAGDVIVKKNRQITTAVSDGTNAALSILEYLNSEFKKNV